MATARRYTQAQQDAATARSVKRYEAKEAARVAAEAARNTEEGATAMKWTDLPENYRTAIARTFGTTRRDIRKHVTDVRVPMSGNLQGEGYLVYFHYPDGKPYSTSTYHVYPWGRSIRVRNVD